MAFLMSYFKKKANEAPSPQKVAVKKTLSQLGIDDDAVPESSWNRFQMPVRSGSFGDLSNAPATPPSYRRPASTGGVREKDRTMSLSSSLPSSSPTWMLAEDEQPRPKPLAVWKRERDEAAAYELEAADGTDVNQDDDDDADDISAIAWDAEGNQIQIEPTTAAAAGALVKARRAPAGDHTQLLPNELIQRILRYTDAGTIGRAAQVCFRWNVLARSRHIQQQPGFKIDIRFAKYRTGQAAPDPVASVDDQINALALAPDGTLFAAAGQVIRVIRPEPVQHGEADRVLKGHTDMVCALALGADGVLFSGGFDKSIIAWDAAGNQLYSLVGHTGSVRALALSPDGRLLYSGGHDKKVRVWTLDGSSPVKILEGHRSGVYALAVSPDGKRVYSGAGSKDARIHVWSQDGDLEQVLTGHQGGVFALATAGDGTLYSGSVDKTIRIWSPEGKLAHTVRGHRFTVQTLAVHAGKLFSGSIDTTVRVWDRHSGAYIQTLSKHSGTVAGLAVTTIGRVYSAAQDKSILLW